MGPSRAGWAGVVRYPSRMGGWRMTGEELKAQRKRLRLSRPALAALAGVHPDTVKYWECRAVIDLRGWAPHRLLNALGVGHLSQKNIFPGPHFHAEQGNFATLTRARDRVLVHAENRSKRCDARTRRGTPCRAKPISGKARCKFHGGMSTGPKTQEGRERVAQAQKRRWRRWRAERQG